MLTETIKQILEGKCDWDPIQPVVVGVSGGADSIALLHTLQQIGAKVIVGHFNHHLRATADRDAEFVERLCRNSGLPYEMGQADVHQLAEKGGIGIEEAARRARYGFLFAIARQHGAQAVVTAHHMDDQVETILMHFLRGSGLDGLTGMPFRGVISSFDKDIPIFRPLLGVRKAAILKYCEEEGLDFVEDETNQQNHAFRNRLRNELLPILEMYNPNIRGTILRNAQAISGDQAILFELERAAFRQCMNWMTRDSVCFSRATFGNLGSALQARVIRHALKLIAPDMRDFSFELLQTALDAVGANQKYLPLTDRLGLWCIEDTIQILPSDQKPQMSAYPQLLSDADTSWKVGSSFQLDRGWKLFRELVDRGKFNELDQVVKTDPMHAWVQISSLDAALTVRPIEIGEAFSPLGMWEGHQKLSDLFVNQKIPQLARAKWPVVTVGDSIVWVVGLRIGNKYRLTDDDGPILHLWAERLID